MIPPDSHVAGEVKSFCTRIGNDPLLVQGAGGNVSWKTGDTLWVKASGTWLADAEAKDIFVPIDLHELRWAISRNDFAATPKLRGEARLRPSIETALHALMPHAVVAHLHAVEILARLVRTGAEEELRELVPRNVKWTLVDYFKPGADLAEASFRQLRVAKDTDVVFLRNHGVVVGAGNVARLEEILEELLGALRCPLISHEPDMQNVTIGAAEIPDGYQPCVEEEINQLAMNRSLSFRLRGNWALYPDHVVFLGPEARIIERGVFSKPSFGDSEIAPPYIFHLGVGVLESRTVNRAQKVQLKCYYDVLVRQSPSVRLLSLDPQQINALLGWESEKYRQRQ